MWDDDFDSPNAAPAPASSGFGRGGGSVSQNGVCIGRGRGFGNMSNLSNALPQPGESKGYNSTPANDSGWQENDSGWDEGGSTTNNTSSWQEDSSTKRYGGGGNNYSQNGYGSSNRACFKCKQEGHMSRDCPNNRTMNRFSKTYTGGSGGGRACHKCNQEGHMARDCPTGGSRGGGSRTCNKCGEEGHFARECPSGGGGGGGGRACHKCGQEGHMARDCTSGGGGGYGGSSGGGGGRACHKCGEEGHFARECPNSGGGGGGYGGGGSGGRACHKCGEEGHMARDCTSGGSSGGGGGGRACHKCGEEGHFARECPNSGGGGGYGGGGGGGRACHKCGEEGHMARDCTSGGSSGGYGGGGGDSGSSGCRNCGEDGHFARDCTKPKMGPDGKPMAPLYIPEDYTNDVDKLFESITTGINFAKYESIPVVVTGNNAPPGINSFDSANLSKHLLGNIARAGYKVPTPVQKRAIPIIMQGRDLMACAETGSGKTAAFLLPIIHNLITDSNLPNNANKSEQEPIAVIVSPTRELAIQIMTEAKKFSYDSVVRADVVYGGTSTAYQSSRMKKGIHILVATPGRLLDFVEKSIVSLSKVRYFVLDEADRMLDMGFMPSIKRMVDTMPPKGERQTLMFSATFAEEIQQIASDFLNDYLFLNVGIVGGANSDVQQMFFKLGQYEKRDKLMEILRESGTDRVLVFVEQKRTADFLASFTSQREIPTTSIHGDRLQKEREEALRDFRVGKMPVLVATAVAARGLDIKDVRHVINYDLPKSIDEYVHRIGRTGRVGNLGKATSFYDPEVDKDLVRSLKKILIDANQEIPDWLHEEATHAVGTTMQYSRGNFGGRDFRSQGGRSQGGGQSDDWGDGDGGAQQSNTYSQPIETEECWD